MSRSTRRKPPLSEPAPPLSPLPPPTQPPTGWMRLALPCLILHYLVFACLHACYVPTGQTGYQNAPDEAAHVTYIRVLATGRLPTRDHPETGLQPTAPSYEWHQPPLYYLLALPFLSLGERWLRIASILCGLAAILLIYRAVRQLFPDNPFLAIVATGIAALTPAHIAITSTVNNDGLLEVWFCATLLILIGALMNGFTSWRAGWLGGVLGAAILTKATGLLLLPIALFALILLWRSGEKGSILLRRSGWALTITCVVCGWWFVRNRFLYGQFLPLHAFEMAFSGTTQAKDVVAGKIPGLPVHSWGGYFALVGEWSFMSFWAVYGTPRAAQYGVPVFLRDADGGYRIYLLLAIVCAVIAIGMIRLHLRRRQNFTVTQLHGLWILFATLFLVGMAFLAFILTYFQTQGRYLYPAMLPLCTIIALGWSGVFPARYRGIAGSLLLLFLGILNIALLIRIMP